MGRGIIYCATCGSRILDKDFDSKTAFRLDSRGFCKTCAPEALKSLPPDKMADVLSQISQAESSGSRKALPAGRAQAPAPTPAPAPRRKAVEPSKTPLLIGGGIAVLAIVILAVAFSRSDPPPAPPSRPPATPDRPAKPDRETLAVQALRTAREYRDANPKDVATHIASFTRITTEFKGTRAAEDARRDLEEADLRAREAQQMSVGLLRSSVQSQVEAEEFKSAIDKLTAEKGRALNPVASQEIDRMVTEIRSAAEKLYRPLKEAAIAQRRAGGEAAVRDAQARVARWGFPEYVSGLEAALAVVPPPDKRPMINGKDTTGWFVPRGKYEVKDGMLEAVDLDDKGRAFIHWTEQLSDFELEGMLEAKIRTYIEFNARGPDFMTAIHLDPGWHKFRVAASGTDVKLFVDDNPIALTKGSAKQGEFGIFTLGSVRLRDLKIRP